MENVCRNEELVMISYRSSPAVNFPFIRCVQSVYHSLSRHRIFVLTSMDNELSNVDDRKQLCFSSFGSLNICLLKIRKFMLFTSLYIRKIVAFITH